MKLSPKKLNEGLTLCFPANLKGITLDSPAIEIYTDFKKTRPLVIEGDVKIDDAIELMKNAHVQLKLVVKDTTNLLGIVSYADLIGEKPLQLESRERISRDEILISDIMNPIKNLKALSLADLQESTIREVIEELKDEHVKHQLIIDNGSICGLISATDIAKKVNLPIQIDELSSFKKIFKVM